MGFGIKLINFVSSRSLYCQIVIGAAIGSLTSFALMRFYKLAAALAGGAILVIKIAELEEVLHIVWGREAKNHKSIKFASRKNFIRNKNLKEKAKNLTNFQIAFVGGFLIGVGCF